MLRHRPKALSAAGILPEGCLMALYVLENQSFPPTPLHRIAPFRVTSRPRAEPSFSNLPWVPACTPVFAQPSFPLFSCCCQRIHIQAAASFFPQPYLGSLIATVKLFYNRFCYQEWIFLFYHYPNPNYPFKAFLHNIRFTVLSVGCGIVVHFEI